MVILKYPLRLTDQQDVVMPVGADIFTAKMQSGTLWLWAIVDESVTEALTRDIRILGTGNPFPEDLKAWQSRDFIGTVFDGSFVWHVFERLSE
jgi:hypothetical protein